MRHRVRRHQLGRTASEKRALMKGLAAALVIHGRVRTTVAKAKALRPYAERLVTRARRDTLANRRLIAARIPDPAVVRKLFAEIAPRYAERAGGYLRIVRVSGFRRGDATPLAEVQWV